MDHSSVENCPTPILLEDDEGIDEESEDATVDIQYWFPNNGNMKRIHKVS